MMNEHTKAEAAKNTLLFQFADAERRKKQAKVTKELSKDIFDIIRNAFIVAGVQAVSKIADIFLIDFLWFFLICVFTTHIIGVVLERFAPLPKSWRKTNIYFYILISIAGIVIAGGVKGLIDTSEAYLISRVAQPQNDGHVGVGHQGNRPDNQSVPTNNEKKQIAQ